MIGKLKIFIFSTFVAEYLHERLGYEHVFQSFEKTLETYFGEATYMVATETLQVSDYSKYHMSKFNETDRKKRRVEVFPTACEKAFALGKSMLDV